MKKTVFLLGTIFLFSNSLFAQDRWWRFRVNPEVKVKNTVTTKVVIFEVKAAKEIWQRRESSGVFRPEIVVRIRGIFDRGHPSCYGEPAWNFTGYEVIEAYLTLVDDPKWRGSSVSSPCHDLAASTYFNADLSITNWLNEERLRREIKIEQMIGPPATLVADFKKGAGWKLTISNIGIQ